MPIELNATHDPERGAAGSKAPTRRTPTSRSRTCRSACSTTARARAAASRWATASSILSALLDAGSFPGRAAEAAERRLRCCRCSRSRARRYPRLRAALSELYREGGQRRSRGRRRQRWCRWPAPSC